MRHRATASFWRYYDDLPDPVRRLADKNFALLKQDPRHPSLHFKKVSGSVRIGREHRALGLAGDGEVSWFWIGDHAGYERLIA